MFFLTRWKIEGLIRRMMAVDRSEGLGYLMRLSSLSAQISRYGVAAIPVLLRAADKHEDEYDYSHGRLAGTIAAICKMNPRGKELLNTTLEKGCSENVASVIKTAMRELEE